jgi:phosphatidylinositol alpha-1,6-mannosyltransferase
MKILLLSWNFAPVIGGLEDLITNLFRSLRQLGLSVQLVTAGARGSTAEEGVSRAPREGLWAFLLHACRAGWRIGRSFDPDVILCGSVVSAPVGWLLSRGLGAPLVVIIHGSDVLFDHPLYRRGVRFALGRADAVVANSHQTRRLAVAAGIDPTKLAVVHPGVDVERFHAIANPEAPTQAGGPMLLSVARLVRRKGILEFIEHVMPRLVEAHPTLSYVVVGGDATASLAHRERLGEVIADKVRELDLEGHVELRGEVPTEELIRLYRQADLFVLPVLDVPGDVEGFGIVFLEASLGSTPSVSTRVGGVPEAIEEGKSGVLVEPGDHAAMAGAIQRLLEDPELRKTLGSYAEQRARQQFGWPAVAARYSEELRRVIDRGGRRARALAETD